MITLHQNYHVRADPLTEIPQIWKQALKSNWFRRRQNALYFMKIAALFERVMK